MTDTPKVKGPASYFPSIEKTYGQPIAHWMALLSIWRAASRAEQKFRPYAFASGRLARRCAS